MKHPSAHRTAITLLACVMAWLVAIAPSIGEAAVADNLANDVRSAFLYRFLDYISWPSGASLPENAPFVIAVAGGEAATASLARTTANRKAGTHPIAVQKLNGSNDLSGVQVLYVTDASTEDLARYAAKARETGTLLVSDQADAFGSGSMINFVEVNGHVRFEVDMDSARKAGIRLGSGLLSVALRVKDTP